MSLNEREHKFTYKLLCGLMSPFVTTILVHHLKWHEVYIWAGLMTWRRWRRYIQLTSGLTLADHFISRSHYMTEELLVHAGINHNLTLFHAFPHLPLSEYSLRNTGNRGLEAIHGIFRGGSSCLPITCPNLSFREFLSKITRHYRFTKQSTISNKFQDTQLWHQKRRRVQCAQQSSDRCSEQEYTKPEQYQDFVKQLADACLEGDEDSRLAISQLAPEMTAMLKKNNEWNSPKISIDPPPSNLSLVSDHATLTACTPQMFDNLIDKVLGSETIVPNPNSTQSHLTNSDIAEAYANFITDVAVTESDDVLPPSPKRVQMCLKDLQPYREKPSKDRSKRFAVGDLPLTSEIDLSYDIRNHQYWTLHPSDSTIRSAKVFILSQIIYISESEKPVQQSMKANPNTRIMLNVYGYDLSTLTYTPAGRSALLNAYTPSECN